MNVQFFLIATLFLALGPQRSLTVVVGIGRSLSRSSSRISSSSISSARSSSASSTYGGSRYTVISARASVYGYSAYTARGSGNYDPTVCFNNETLSDLQGGAKNESISVGYYVCPLPGDSDSMYCCCGAEEAQYCCSFSDYTLMYYSGHIFGAAGALLVLIAFVVIAYLKKKFKRRISAARQRGSHAEATGQEARPQLCGTTQSAEKTSCSRIDMHGRHQHEPVTSSWPPVLIEGSHAIAEYPHLQYPGDVQLPRYQENAPIQMPLCESAPPKYEDATLPSNDFAVRSSVQ